MRGKKVAPGVKFYLAAASAQCRKRPRSAAFGRRFWLLARTALPSGCGPCIGLGTGLLEAGEVGISATNRNFKGRMGSRDAQCYLASPEVVAASAVAGYICGPAQFDARAIRKCISRSSRPRPPRGERSRSCRGFPRSLRGRLVFLPQDNLNTDGIYGKDYTYREDMTPEMMARVVMENYDPAIRRAHRTPATWWSAASTSAPAPAASRR